jgi:sulfur carrier protein
MKVIVNDEEMQIDDQSTVTSLLERLGIPDKGIAVAVDWAVVPRSDWHRTLSDGARLEVVTAVQGG